MSAALYLNTNWPEICGHTIYAGGLDRDSVVLDLGANIAMFSQTVAARFGSTCHAVEALPVNFDNIVESPRLRRHQFAVCDVDGTIDVATAAGEFPSSTFLPSLAEGSVRLPAITLDTLFGRLGLDTVDLLKVDIEGAELAMFAAASDATIRRCSQITVEFHDFVEPDMGPAIERTKDRLHDLGFSSIKFTRKHHGDVLFVDLDKVPISALDFARAKNLIRYSRGMGRIVSRSFGRLGGLGEVVVGGRR
jgi:FkbM family methyltransferase